MDLVFKSTSIWVSSMTHSPVFSVWTSTLSLKGQEAESAFADAAKAELEPSIKSPRRRPWNGSRKNTMVQFTTDMSLALRYKYYFHIYSIKNSIFPQIYIHIMLSWQNHSIQSDFLDFHYFLRFKHTLYQGYCSLVEKSKVRKEER